MITVRRAGERGHVRRRRHEAWLTFFPEDPTASLVDGFGVLVILNEARLAPNAGVSLHPKADAEVITYVLEGAIAYQDSEGNSGVINAGEFRRMTAGDRIRYRQANALQTDWVHAFQIGLRLSGPMLNASYEQKRFTLAERQGALCTIASPDGRSASLHIHQDALIYSAVLDPGQHVVHELLPGRKAWVHLVYGEVTLGNLVLTTGDGAGVTIERAVALTARHLSEVLLVDLPAPIPRAALPRAERPRRVIPNARTEKKAGPPPKKKDRKVVRESGAATKAAR